MSYVILIWDGSPFKKPLDYQLNPLFPAFGRTSSKWEVFTCVCWSRERWHFPADGANIAAALLASNTAQDRRNQDLRQILPFGPRLTNLRERMWRHREMWIWEYRDLRINHMRIWGQKKSGLIGKAADAYWTNFLAVNRLSTSSVPNRCYSET